MGLGMSTLFMSHRHCHVAENYYGLSTYSGFGLSRKTAQERLVFLRASPATSLWHGHVHHGLQGHDGEFALARFGARFVIWGSIGYVI